MALVCEHVLRPAALQPVVLQTSCDSRGLSVDVTIVAIASTLQPLLSTTTPPWQLSPFLHSHQAFVEVWHHVATSL